jgi:hypothetical protein
LAPTFAAGASRCVCRTDPNPYLDVVAVDHIRLEDGSIGSGHLVRGRLALGRARQRGGIGGRAGVRPVDGKHAELCE